VVNKANKSLYILMQHTKSDKLMQLLVLATGLAGKQLLS
jgi:hypothetical protein